MGDRHKLRLLEQMLEIRQARRLAAEAALAAAVVAQREARQAEEEARQQSNEAHAEWSHHLTHAGFSPEIRQALAARLHQRDTKVEQAVIVTSRKTEVHAESKDGWQLAEAALRQARAKVKQTRRKTGRRAEETRLAELSDRVTWNWSSK